MSNCSCCPVCGGQTSLLDVVDFNKSCEEARGKFLQLAGMPVYYARCGNCGFCFAPEISSWKLEEFEHKIYNNDYVLVDPDYIETRPRVNAANLVSMFGDRAHRFKHLDYGGGSGLMVKLLRESGWQSTSYDPFVNRNIDICQLGKFDLVTAFEVFEHVPDVHELMANLRLLLASNGIVLFSTLLSDGNIQAGQRLSWWYASPRNGHISLFSRRSLSILAQKHGFGFGSFSEGFHFLHTRIPDWATHLIRVPEDVVPQASMPAAVDETLLRALTHHKQGQFKDAERLYREILKIHPCHPDANHSMGILAMQQGQLAIALPFFKTALDADPNKGQFWLSYINALIQSGAADEAQTVLEAGLKQGLNGEAVDALAARFKDSESTTSHENLSVFSSGNGQAGKKELMPEPERPIAKKVAHRRGKKPENREINALADLFSRGQYQKAADIATRMTEQFPDHGFGWKTLGAALKLMGRPEDAIAFMQKAAELSPDDAEAHKNLGILLHEMNRLPEAEAAYLRVIELKPDVQDAHYNLGILYKKAKQHFKAEAHFLRAIELNPGAYEVHNNLGILLQETRQFSEAEAHFLRAIELNPGAYEVHNNLGILLQETRQFSGAEAHFLRAIELNPGFGQAYNNLGNLYGKMGRFADAEGAYLRATGLEPRLSEFHHNLGVLLKNTKRMPESEAAFLRAIEVGPDYVDSKYSLGEVLLGVGRYTEAWPYYEFRYHPGRKEHNVFYPDLPYPQWQGESLQGKSLLIYPEQGFGDYIQFSRYAPMLKDRGVFRLTFYCPQPLKSLLETVTGVDEVITELPASDVYDYWTYPLSLPLHFSTSLENLPATLPYLQALPERIREWQDRMPRQGFRVGLVWKGNSNHVNDDNRSLPGISTLYPLWSIPGVTFVSLQKGQGESDSDQKVQQITSLGAEIKDFADTAAIVTQLDLVICVDTAVAHVAGALGKPCWVLLPAYGTDWRWLQDRNDSPWYPEVMRIFRQSTRKEWDQTIYEVAVELNKLVTTFPEGGENHRVERA